MEYFGDGIKDWLWDRWKEVIGSSVFAAVVTSITTTLSGIHGIYLYLLWIALASFGVILFIWDFTSQNDRRLHLSRKKRISMTPKEILLTSALLKMAADEFGNHGCNDMDKGLLKKIGFTDEEKIELARQFHEWNGDLEEFEGTIRDFNGLGDSVWMSFMAHKLKEGLSLPRPSGRV